ncbi:MAG: hypothetical protein GTN62_06480 [Gemmatimonadales bacterium]|nr:hypothetical protein [Gemmatimonadales bacterium]NIN11143.1 hypothetical protein [Gemmatimonadales bacterium]NIN49742.1 hypothetical protein [Gemmatimonadales bacterium]NIP07206.1 hypothetical protein [Gemmatimonadales bacterium]NIR00419.1 hypothetical protein [Gemmatimonadales bacterium]
MVKVSDLKDQARSLEQQGQLEQALAIYQHILKSLEGTTDLKRQLPLYVKSGDLLLKLKDPKSAVRMYEQAGEHYAAYGSAPSVILVCDRVLHALPSRTGDHFHFARQMVKRGFIAQAREVLADCATRHKLGKMLAALGQLAGRPDDEVRPVLERLLEKAGRRAEPSAPPVSPKAKELEREAAEAAPARKPAERPVPERPAVRPSPVERPEPRERVTRPAAEQVARRPAAVKPGPAVSQVPKGVPGAVADSRPASAPTAAPRAAPREPPWRPAVPVEPVVAPVWERKKSRRPLVELGALAAVVVAVAGLFWSGVIPIEDLPFVGGRPPDQAALSAAPLAQDSVAPAAVPSDTGVSAAAVGDTAVATEADSTPAQVPAGPARAQRPVTQPATPPVAAERRAPAQVQPRPARVQQPAAEPARPPPRARETPADTAARRTPPAAAVPIPDTTPRVAAQQQPPRVAAPPPARPSSIVMVQGLGMVSVTDVSAGGTVEYRVVQRLASGEPLTLNLVFLGADSAGVPATGEIQVTSLPGDSAVGTTRFANFLVNARGRVSADTLEALLRRLVELSSD